MKIDPDTITWLLNSAEPWTRYRTLLDLLEYPQDHPQVRQARADMLAHPQVGALIQEAAGWPGYALQRHNDARHPLYKLSVLADFGLRADDPGMSATIERVLAHHSPEGALESLVLIPPAFGGTGSEVWAWMACDAPTLLYVMLAMGLGEDGRVKAALSHLASLATEIGWRCTASPELGRFKGPGRRSDPCPIANVYALKALAQASAFPDSPCAIAGVEMLLHHWERQGELKYFLFGVGTDYRRLKYPFIWYDLLHVADVLSLYPSAQADPRYRAMLDAIVSQAGDQGRYRPTSMYLAWKGWSFADKKNPSPWLTFLALRLQKRCVFRQNQGHSTTGGN